MLGAVAHGAEKGKLGEPIVVRDYRVTLLSVSELSSADRKTKDTMAPGGRRTAWLIEPPEGATGAPAFGEARIRINGATYNKARASLIVHEYVKLSAEGRSWFVAARQPVRRNALVAEVLIRGGELSIEAHGVAELQVAVDGSKKFVWFSAPFGQPD